MTKIQYVKLFNELENSEGATILRLIYASLISSDTVTDLKKCSRSKEELQKMLEAVVSCDVNDVLKKEWKNRIEKGLEICEKDRQNFINENNEEIH